MLDNSQLIAPFCPEKADGDTFIYTEMLNRGQKKGNNGQRLLKTFYHRSIEEFWEQWPTIKELCDMSKVRACTRVAPRSYKKVGREFTKLVVDTAMSENWAGMKSLYNRACGTTSPNTKIWLFDVDVINTKTITFGEWLKIREVRIACIPSKKGMHYLTKPFDVRDADAMYRDLGLNLEGVDEISLHKDNPTNLYIPDGAD